MATLALFFTINRVLKTPFLVFDEADAFLDLNNTKKFLEIIKKVNY
jgi:chromosome segregation ATPase